MLIKFINKDFNMIEKNNKWKDIHYVFYVCDFDIPVLKIIQVKVTSIYSIIYHELYCVR